MEPKRWSVCAPWVFREVEYTVSAEVREDALLVQVEEKPAADQWRGRFEAKHIEELTRKTGNFKQFAVFLNMLESAVTKSSESVSLDLLTYADLEALRNRKLGTKFSSPAKATKQLHSKRYLILTYSVEFDRIHYPLALPYAGKPDPAILQETIRELQAELERCRKQTLQGKKQSASARLQRDYEALLQEKEEVEEAFEAFRQEVMLTREGSASKEIHILKKVIKNLEEDILKERTKHQRYANKRNEEIRALMQELEELRSSERMLHTRVKSLTNELAVLKRGLRPSPSNLRGGSSSKRNSHLRHRSSSTERRAATAGPHRHRIRTPSPSGARVPRFDPTAYVENRQRKQLQVDTKLGRVRVVKGHTRVMRSRSNSAEQPRLPPRPSPALRHTGRSSKKTANETRRRPRTSSVGSAGSRGSSRASSRRSSADLSGSGSSVILIASGRSRGPYTRRSSSGKKRSSIHIWDSPTVTASTPAKVKRTATTQDDTSQLDHSAEISEIDARLNALQQFMKKSLETTKTHSNR